MADAGDEGKGPRRRSTVGFLISFPIHFIPNPYYCQLTEYTEAESAETKSETVWENFPKEVNDQRRDNDQRVNLLL